MSGRGLKILKYPDPRLKQPNKQAVFNEQGRSEEADYAIKQLFHAIRNVRWGKPVGMAAPQIGINLQLFVVKGEAFVNPRIVKAEKFSDTEEGCYSLEAQKFDYSARRPSRLTLEYQDIGGHKHSETFSGKMAQIIHHEYDHLEGRVCAEVKNKKEKNIDAKGSK